MQHEQSIDFLKNAQKAIETPEVQEMLERLSKYGLGIFVPHYHPKEGGFSPLPKDIVALEKGLQVSFVSKNDKALAVKEIEDIGWRWDDEQKTVMKCTWCCQIGCWH